MQDSNGPYLAYSNISVPPLTGGTGSGGGVVEVSMKDYVDAQDEKTRAQNDARFAEVLSGLGRVDERVSHIAAPMTWQQLVLTMASVGLVLIGVVFAALSYASDRIDGGIAASGLLDEFSQSQAERDVGQDAKLDKIIGKLDAISIAQPQKP